MTKHSIEVRQLKTYGGAFFNVNDRIDGHLEVWGNFHMHPTYFVRDGAYGYHLFTFENQEYADEYFAEHKKYYTKITKLEPEE
jgi:hypothetical protein